MLEFDAVGGCLIGLLVILISYLIWKQQHVWHGFPPGPFCFPIFGNIPQVVLSGLNLVTFMNNCAKTYGDVFTIEFGGNKRIVISGYEAMYQFLITNSEHTDEMTSQSMSPAWREMFGSAPGVMFAPHPHWKTLRNLTTSLLRNRGADSRGVESIIQIEVQLFCSRFIESCLNSAVCITQPLQMFSCNVISEFVVGGRLDYDDPKLLDLVDSIDQCINNEMKAAMLKNVPFIDWFTSSSTQTSQLANSVIFTEMQSRLEQHKADFNPSELNDVFDMFLDYQQTLTADELRSKCFTDKSAVVLAFQVFVAGTDTTSASLSWLLLYSTYNPEVVKNVQKEIIKVIGFDRPPAYSDRKNMPYTEAVIMEMFRLSSINIAGSPYYVKEVITIQGTRIPAGADVIMNMSSVHHDETVFEDPFQFKPERYLTGDVKLKRQRTLPFLMGKRACLGEGLARMELFLLYVTLLQKYAISFPDSCSKPLLNAKITVLAKPEPYQLIFSKLNPESTRFFK